MLSQQRQLQTFLVLVAASLLLIAYELWTIQRHGHISSISRVAIAIFQSCPTLAVLVLIWIGILIGHLMPANPNGQ